MTRKPNLTLEEINEIIAKLDPALDERIRDDTKRAKMRDQQKIQWTPDRRANNSEQVRRLWDDPTYRAHQTGMRKETWNDPELLARMSEQATERMRSPERRAKASEYGKKANDAITPEMIAKQRVTMTSKWEDPEFRAKRIAAIKAGVAATKARNKG